MASVGSMGGAISPALSPRADEVDQQKTPIRRPVRHGRTSRGCGRDVEAAVRGKRGELTACLDRAKKSVWFKEAFGADLSKRPFKVFSRRNPSKLNTRVRFPSPAPIFSTNYPANDCSADHRRQHAECCGAKKPVSSFRPTPSAHRRFVWHIR